jgi:hypothetical protein
VASLDIELLSGDRTGQCGIHVAYHHYPVGLLFNTHLLKRDHGVAYLFGVRSGSYLQIDIRIWDSQRLKEGFTHPHIVVLAGVEEDGGEEGVRCGVIR